MGDEPDPSLDAIGGRDPEPGGEQGSAIGDDRPGWDTCLSAACAGRHGDVRSGRWRRICTKARQRGRGFRRFHCLHGCERTRSRHLSPSRG